MLQPSTPSMQSRSSHRLMWFSAKGRLMRIPSRRCHFQRAARGGQCLAQRVMELHFQIVHGDGTFLLHN